MVIGRSRLPRWRLALLALVLSWFVVTWLWANSPIHDSVPTGLVNNVQTTQVVACDSPLSSNSGPSGPLPSLPDGRAYERAPCDRPHQEYRLLFGTDATLAMAAVLGLIFIRKREPRVPEDGSAGLLVRAGRT
jgi:hypothetical protein